MIFLDLEPNSSISPRTKYFLNLFFLIILNFLIAFLTDNGLAL